MTLRPNFELVRAALMNRDPTPSLEQCVQFVLREELRLVTQQALTNDPKAFVVPPSETATLVSKTALLAPRGSKPLCYECKGYGHVAKFYNKSFCNYCKCTDHVISDYTQHPQRRNAPPPPRYANQLTAIEAQAQPPNVDT